MLNTVGGFGEHVSATGRVPSTQEQGKRGVALGDLKTEQEETWGCICTAAICSRFQVSAASGEFLVNVLSDKREPPRFPFMVIFTHIHLYRIKCGFRDIFPTEFSTQHTVQNRQNTVSLNIVRPQSFLFGFHHGRLLRIRKFLTLHCGC